MGRAQTQLSLAHGRAEPCLKQLAEKGFMQPGLLRQGPDLFFSLCCFHVRVLDRWTHRDM